MNKRVTFILVTLLSFLLCIIILKFFNTNQFIRGSIGDLLVVILIYGFIKSIKDIKAKKLALCVLAFAYFTEFLQYLHLVDYLGLTGNRVAQIILGSVFDVKDLIAYSVGVMVIYLFDRFFFERGI